MSFKDVLRKLLPKDTASSVSIRFDTPIVFPPKLHLHGFTFYVADLTPMRLDGSYTYKDVKPAFAGEEMTPEAMSHLYLKLLNEISPRAKCKWDKKWRNHVIYTPLGWRLVSWIERFSDYLRSFYLVRFKDYKRMPHMDLVWIPIRKEDDHFEVERQAECHEEAICDREMLN